MEKEGELVWHVGGCHCGAVRFEVLAKPDIIVMHCNCSICVMKQNAHFIVPESKFRLIRGAETLSTYTFNTHRAKHTFCSVCGVQSFYTPRSNPDGKGIMPHCIVSDTIRSVRTEHFDGTQWEKQVEQLQQLRQLSANK